MVAGLRVFRQFEMSAAIIKLLQDKSMNKSQLAVALNIPNAKSNRRLSPMIDWYHDQGLLYIERWKSWQSPCFRWNPKPFEIGDAARPEKRHT